MDFTVSGESAFGRRLVAYPNPSNGNRLYLTGLGNTQVSKARIYDAHSRLIQELNIQNSGGALDIEWPVNTGEGMYFIELRNKEQPVFERIKVLRF